MNRYLLHKNSLNDYPNCNDEIKNLLTDMDANPWKKQFIDWVNSNLNSLYIKKRKDLYHRLFCDYDTFQGAIGEISYMSLWHRLNWDFQKDPELDRKTPDFGVNITKSNELDFICDITTAHHDHQRSEHPKFINQAHRAIIEIDQKFKKYHLLNNKLVVGFYQYKWDDQFYLAPNQVYVALYGDMKINFANSEKSANPKELLKDGKIRKRGIFAFPEYINLPATILCQLVWHSDKYFFDFYIFINPLGKWSKPESNPFKNAGLTTIYPEDDFTGLENKKNRFQFY